MSAEVSEGKSVAAVPVVLAPALPPDESVTHRCANCLTPLTGPFCSQCGQHVADYHRSVWRFVADFFENSFCWDNKLLRTLDPLLRRPGWLTQEFMAGRRVRYVHPLRLFLFTSAICLTLIQYVHRDPHAHARTHADKDAKPGLSIQSSDEEKDSDEDDDEKKPAASPAPALSSGSPAAPAAAATPAEPTLGQVFHDTYKHRAETQGTATAAAAGKKANDSLDAAAKKMEAAAAKMDAAGKTMEFREKITTNLQQKLSWVALAMLPIFALLMRWSYGRWGGYYFTYLVFSLHYHTFLLLFWVAYAVLDALASHLNSFLFQLPGLCVGLCLLLPPYYLYRALRQMYGQGRFATTVKVGVIGTLHLLALFTGLAIIGATSFL